MIENIDADALLELVFDRLAADGLDARSAEVVLAAMGGPEELARALADGSRLHLPEKTPQPAPATRSVQLKSVTVTGFRGVGLSCTLSVPAGPGLTLVVGRNGSGKSSFAEATELALTGISPRWADKTTVWQSGWRNLHHTEETAIEVELIVDGQAAPVRVRRQWPAGARLDDAQTTVTGATSLDALGLSRPLQLYRPFLSAQDLDKLISGKPSEQYDAIFAILGLQRLATADKTLREAITPLQARAKEVRDQRTRLHTRLKQLDGDSAAQAMKLLAAADGRNERELDALQSFVTVEAADPRTETTIALRALLQLNPVSEERVIGLAKEVRASVAELAAHSAEGIGAAGRVGDLLALAIAGHAEMGDGPCPVCGVGVLNDGWRTTAERELARLRALVDGRRRAEARLQAAERDLRTAIASPKLPDLPAGVPDDVRSATTELREILADLHTVPGDPAALAEHVTSRYAQVIAAYQLVREQAAHHFAEQEQAWQAVAAELSTWVDLVRRSAREQSDLLLLSQARTWLGGATAKLRDARLAPFAQRSQEIWRALRQDSNVDLGAMVLAGTNTTRKIEHQITIDGVDGGAALGVMSQGELHALGLATFLPRSCAAESPIGFVLIDDPVQSMDPAKVDGLAQVLEELGQDRQVVVFTHDPRLPDAVRELGIPATVLSVTRAERSVLTIRPQSGPVARYLEDAHAIARTSDIPPGERLASIATFGRHALEAVCHRIIWQTRLAAGHKRDDIAADLEKIHTVTDLFALAYYGTTDEGGKVISRLNAYGRWAGDAFLTCKRGAHPGGAAVAEPVQLVHDIEKLARRIAADLNPVIARQLDQELARGGKP